MLPYTGWDQRIFVICSFQKVLRQEGLEGGYLFMAPVAHDFPIGPEVPF
jgi:hypothetical protein